METGKFCPFSHSLRWVLYKYIRIYIKFSYGILNLLDKARGGALEYKCIIMYGKYKLIQRR